MVPFPPGVEALCRDCPAPPAIVPSQQHPCLQRAQCPNGVAAPLGTAALPAACVTTSLRTLVLMCVSLPLGSQREETTGRPLAASERVPAPARCRLRLPRPARIC